jgi:trehalose synthase
MKVSARSVEPFEALLGRDRIESLRSQAEAVRVLLGRRAVWNVSSTAVGGGVAELLRSLLRYARGLGIDARWLVIQGPPEFFRLTKRIHHALHGSHGDGSPLGREQAELYAGVMRENLDVLDTLVRQDDVVLLHDPQTVGLAPHLIEKGVRVVWRCHIGHDRHGAETDAGWAFLHPYLRDVPFAVFSRSAYAPSWLEPARTVVLPPTIDPFAAKNQSMSSETVCAILSHVGLIDARGSAATEPCGFLRDDGSPCRVDRAAEVIRVGRAPAWDTPLVVQVSRWDPIKDPIGVLHGFASNPYGSELVLAGPDVRSVEDDPEDAKVFAELEQAWRALPYSIRRIVHLALLPMQDIEENAAIVNALQRHASIIVQKSLHEGFGLTVAEAMWKRRPVVASAVGGIRDQVRDGVDGLLLADPSNLADFNEMLVRVLSDPALASRLGDAAYERVKNSFTSISSLEEWAALVTQLVESAQSAAAAPRRASGAAEVTGAP